MFTTLNEQHNGSKVLMHVQSTDRQSQRNATYRRAIEHEALSRLAVHVPEDVALVDGQAVPTTGLDFAVQEAEGVEHADLDHCSRLCLEATGDVLESVH